MHIIFCLTVFVGRCHTYHSTFALIHCAMTGMENLTIPDDAFLNALRKIEASYQEDQNGINDNIILLDENKHNVGANKTLACSCVITLCKILDNIILEKKYNAKTRSIKLSNKLFKDKVGKVQGGGKVQIVLLFCQLSFQVVCSLLKFIVNPFPIQLSGLHDGMQVYI